MCDRSPSEKIAWNQTEKFSYFLNTTTTTHYHRGEYTRTRLWHKTKKTLHQQLSFINSLILFDEFSCQNPWLNFCSFHASYQYYPDQNRIIRISLKFVKYFIPFEAHFFGIWFPTSLIYLDLSGCVVSLLMCGISCLFSLPVCLVS